jgi:NAD-dependent dihydropyrimidine dehydrogenase PreA subunit
MAVRQIIEIDEDLCDGCGDCVSACAEGAIKLIDGKAKLISDTYCDGLGACLGDCHVGAIKIIERDAGGFDEEAVAVHLTKIGRGHEQISVPRPLNIVNPISTGGGGGCPGSRAQTLQPAPVTGKGEVPPAASQLGHWPIQLHLVPPSAPFFQGADVLLAADCVPFAVGDFHQRYLAGHSLAIACPKLDHNQEIYLDKLVAMIETAQIASMHVMVMEVPCCSGLVRLVDEARKRATRQVPIKCTVIGTDGAVRHELELERSAV